MTMNSTVPCIQSAASSVGSQKPDSVTHSSGSASPAVTSTAPAIWKPRPGILVPLLRACRRYQASVSR